MLRDLVNSYKKSYVTVPFWTFFRTLKKMGAGWLKRKERKLNEHFPKWWMGIETNLVLPAGLYDLVLYY